MPFVITKEYNQYDQYGEYFVAVFEHFPTIKDLRNLGLNMKVADGLIAYMGGRKEVEEEWYNMREIKFGELF